MSKVWVDIRKGRKIVKSGKLSTEQLTACLADAFQYDLTKAMLCYPTLARGETFKYKHNGYNVTVSPILNEVYVK